MPWYLIRITVTQKRSGNAVYLKLVNPCIFFFPTPYSCFATSYANETASREHVKVET